MRLELVAVGVAGACDGRFADAVEVVALGAVLPVFALGRAELGAVDARPRPRPVAAFGLRVGLVALGGRRTLGRRRIERRRRFLVGFEEGVLLEHLLDFLVQLERGQLQQADRLLQLRRQRQVLRQADLQ